MGYYQITSKAGMDMGTYEGETAAQAIAAMHRDAGYRVSVSEDGALAFADEADREVAGDVDDWLVEEV